MSRIIIHKRKSGKFDYTIVGSDVNENILVSTVQGFERKHSVIDNCAAVYDALGEGNFVHMTHAQYTEFMKGLRRVQARNRRARGRK